MSDDYLWNRTGAPDPETVRLENLLGRLKYSGSGEFRNAAPSSRRRTAMWWLAAAALAIAAAMTPLFLRGPATNWRRPDGRRLRAGQIIETGSADAKIESADTGVVTIDAGSRLRLLRASGREQRFDLEVGAIHAFIWAPPRMFVVDTPSSKTVDLGCRYTLHVSKDGTGLLAVEFGWVAFERAQVESFVPAGAACKTRPGTGPGTPYFEDAPAQLQDALERFDRSGDAGAFESALRWARKRDALSLWHLMVRTQGDRRAEAFDRLSALVNLPPEASRGAILRGDNKAVDATWNALGLGNTSWWREWKQKW